MRPPTDEELAAWCDEEESPVSCAWKVRWLARECLRLREENAELDHQVGELQEIWERNTRGG